MYVDEIVTDRKALSVVSRETTAEEVADLNLVNRIKAAMPNAWTPGCGLASIQIGVPLRFGWYTLYGQDFELLNPRILEYKSKLKSYVEGCLSIPNTWTRVKRYYKIKYVSNGEVLVAKDFKAQIIQHEIDHMNGILNTNRRSLSDK